MKSLSLSFRHPVQGKARFFPILGASKIGRTLIIDSKDSNELEIPLTNLEAGLWKLIFDWKHDGRNFSYQTELEIKQTIAL